MSIVLHRLAATEIAPELLVRWQRVPTAVAIDVSAGRCRIDAAIRPLRPAGSQPRLFGRAVTVRCTPPDFGSVVYALEQVRPGDVVVIDAGGDRATAVIGDVLGGRLRALGAVGIICDGAVRDVGTLAGWHDFAVYSRYVNPRGPTSALSGDLQGVISFGGRLIRPGDLIIGDDDGLCALDSRMAGEYIDLAEAKLAREEAWTAALAAGTPVAAVFGLPPLEVRA